MEEIAGFGLLQSRGEHAIAVYLIAAPMGKQVVREAQGAGDT
jgi:hypothetical protein